jgi:hypothetical protein
VNEKLKCRINKDEIKKEWIKMVENWKLKMREKVKEEMKDDVN